MFIRCVERYILETSSCWMGTFSLLSTLVSLCSTDLLESFHLLARWELFLYYPFVYQICRRDFWNISFICDGNFLHIFIMFIRCVGEIYFRNIFMWDGNYLTLVHINILMFMRCIGKIFDTSFCDIGIFSICISW